MTFYEGLLDTALLARDIDATLVENNSGEIARLTAGIEGSVDMIAGAVSDCKLKGYAEAQEARNA